MPVRRLPIRVFHAAYRQSALHPSRFHRKEIPVPGWPAHRSFSGPAEPENATGIPERPGRNIPETVPSSTGKYESHPTRSGKVSGSVRTGRTASDLSKDTGIRHRRSEDTFLWPYHKRAQSVTQVLSAALMGRYLRGYRTASACGKGFFRRYPEAVRPCGGSPVSGGAHR